MCGCILSYPEALEGGKSLSENTLYILVVVVVVVVSSSSKHIKYLGTTPTNQNCIDEEIQSRLKSGNACYHSVQNLLFDIQKCKD